MPNVPERELSYGEILEKMRILNRTDKRVSEIAKAHNRKAKKLAKRKKYNYGSVKKVISKRQSEVADKRLRIEHYEQKLHLRSIGKEEF